MSDLHAVQTRCGDDRRLTACSRPLHAGQRRRRQRTRAARAVADARRRGAPRRRQQSRAGDRPARNRGGDRAGRARAAARSRRCSRRCSDDRAPSRRRRTSCSVSAASTSTTGSRRPACGSDCRGAPGTWSVSWDTSRTAPTTRSRSFDPSLQSGFQIAFSQPLLSDRAVDAARYQYVDRQAKPGQLGPAVPRSDRPDRGRGEAGLLDAEGGAGQRRTCSSDRSSWRASSRVRTRSASMPDRFRRSISCRPKPKWRSGART